MTLTKADLVQQIYKAHPNLTKSQSTDSVETFLSLSKSSLITGKDLLLSGFGKFNIKDKKSRRGRNPQTGNELTLDARRVVTFKPSGILRSRINSDWANLHSSLIIRAPHPGRPFLLLQTNYFLIIRIISICLVLSSYNCLPQPLRYNFC